MDLVQMKASLALPGWSCSLEEHLPVLEHSGQAKQEGRPGTRGPWVKKMQKQKLDMWEWFFFVCFFPF
jgi:hypothetical protein